MFIESTDQDDAVGYTMSALIDEPVDCRLTSGTIQDVTVHVNRKDRPVANCEVRAVGSHEIVLVLAETEGDLTDGESVTFSLWDGDEQVIPEQLGMVHWAKTEGDARIVALFTLSRLELPLQHRLIDDRRTDIRYPVDLQAYVKVGCGQEAVRIVNYSMNGLCLVSQIALELNRSFRTTVICDSGSFGLSIEPHWIKRIADGNLTGCSLDPHYGVLFARRHTFRKPCALGN